MFKLFMLMLAMVGGAWSVSLPAAQVDTARTTGGDLATAETSAKFLNLFGGGTGGYPNYGYNYQRPTTYPGYNYGYNNNGYYGNSGSYYPNTGGSYYPNTGGSYYPTTGGSYYPTTTGGYPSAGGSYYPTTNILGSQGGYAGYGGYGGNGGLRQYSGYWQRDYQGQRNRGYGYYENTDRFGLPEHRQQSPADRSYGSSGYGSNYGSGSSYGSSSSYRGYD